MKRRDSIDCGRVRSKSAMHQRGGSHLAIHMDEPARQRARELAKTPEFVHAQPQRKKVEALFAELKHQIGLSHLRLRKLEFVREQFFLAAWPRTSSAQDLIMFDAARALAV
jgi:hypothetical protein